MSQQQSMPQPTEKRALVSYLTRLCRDDERGPLAELRRGAGDFPNCGPHVLRHVAPFLPKEPNAIKENALILCAILFALHPSEHDRGGDLGEVFRRICRKRDSESVERRFLAVLGANAEELPTHLRHAVSLAKASEVEIGWSRLLDDIGHLMSGTEWRRQKVVRQWSRSFWSNNDATDEEQSNT